MKKNKTYYQVHKNKNPKNKTKKVDLTSFNEVIIQANKLVKSIIELHKSMYDFSKVKGYTELKQPLAIVGSNDKPEIIVDNFGRNPKHIGTYKELSEAFKNSFKEVSELTGKNGNYPSICSTIDVSGFDGKINIANLNNPNSEIYKKILRLKE